MLFNNYLSQKSISSHEIFDRTINHCLFKILFGNLHDLFFWGCRLKASAAAKRQEKNFFASHIHCQSLELFVDSLEIPKVNENAEEGKLEKEKLQSFFRPLAPS